MKRLSLCLLLAALSGSGALASPIAVGMGAFGGATSISFSGFVNDVEITTQFSGEGLTVSGGLFEDVGGPSSVDLFAGANAASNFLPSASGPGPYNTITLTFSSPVVLLGMNEGSNAGNFNITDSNGSVAYSSSLAPNFAGFEDPAGFTSVTLTVTGAVNNAFGIDSLLFKATTIPEPSSFLLLGTGLLGLGIKAYRSRSKRSRVL